MTKIHNKFKVVILLVTILLTVFSMFHIFTSYQHDVPIAKNGTIRISSKDLEKGFVALNGDFLVYDGLYDVNQINSLNIPAEHMSLEDIRVYPFPKGTATVKMTIKSNVKLSGMIIEEIYTANEVYLNNKLICKSGIVGSKDQTISEKASHLVPISYKGDTLELVIKIANYDQISGQFERLIYIGDYNKLSTFYNKKIAVKFIACAFYLTVSFFLFGLYIKNKKYGYHFTLAIAGFMNFYILLTHFEPIIIFNLKSQLYNINTYFSTFPSLFTQFFSAITVILFYKRGFIYKRIKSFIRSNVIIALIIILIIIIFDEKANPLYILMLIYSMCLLVYGMYIAAKEFVNGTYSALAIFISLLIYVVTYSSLVYITLVIDPKQTLSHYSSYIFLAQIFFYLIICYLSITKFSKGFSISIIEEERLEKMVIKRTEELNQSYLKLIEHEKSKNQMIADISHDLRTPITVIKGYVELIKTGKIKSNDYQKYLQIIHNKICYVSDLISELFLLINLENRTNYQKDVEYIDSIIRDIVSSYSYEDLDIKLELEQDIALYCNEKHIYRLLNNLIENSIEYSQDKAEIKIKAYSANNQVIISIKDKGIGISEDKIPFIFNRFTRNDTARNMDNKHFGLGLAICKAIIDSHFGTITCDSQLGLGSKFTITLPKKEVTKLENFNS